MAEPGGIEAVQEKDEDMVEVEDEEEKEAENASDDEVEAVDASGMDLEDHGNDGNDGEEGDEDDDDEGHAIDGEDNNQADGVEDMDDGEGDDNNDDDGDNDDIVENEEANDNDDEDDDDDSDSGDSSDSDSDSSDDEDESDEDEATKGLSAMEKRRLERIKRNQERLVSLGLEDSKPKAKPKQVRKKKEKVEIDPSDIRKSARATRKTDINYAQLGPKFPRGRPALVGKDRKPRKRGKEKAREKRMERFIYQEFRRIKSKRRLDLKAAEKSLRYAQVELKYTTKRAHVVIKKSKRKQEIEKVSATLDAERKMFGTSLREMLQEVDRRNTELQMALRHHDHEHMSGEKLQKLEDQRREHERKMELIDAMNRFPFALKETVQNMNTLLLERAPKDPPPPRRNRKRGDDDPMQGTESEKPKASPKKEDGEWHGLAAAIAAEKPVKMRDSVVDDDAEEETEVKTARGPKKPKKKKSRNVGGWVSPLFASTIERSWLGVDKYDSNIDLSRFVPQAGDVVLYYPRGHWEFLNVHPDILGKKTRNKTRVPLWTLASKVKDKAAKESGMAADGAAAEGVPNSEAEGKLPEWCDERWLADLESGSGNYPLICRVERTQAEFPPDPTAESKTVTGEDGEVRMIFETKKKGGVSTKSYKNHKPPLCLAVLLKPMTPLLPPEWDGGPINADLSSLPPTFQAVSFPSSKCSPFILPFGITYRIAHSLSLEEKVTEEKSQSRGTIKSFLPAGKGYGSGRLDDKVSNITELLSFFKKQGASSLTASLEASLGLGSQKSVKLPLADAGIAMQMMATAVDSRKASSGQSRNFDVNGALITLIRSTLPLWEGVSLMGDDRKQRTASAWELVASKSASKSQAGGAYSALTDHLLANNGLMYYIDEVLRAKIEVSLEGFTENNEDSHMFWDAVTDDFAPSYSCAVPLGMCFQKVLRRLSTKKTKDDGRNYCYYRSIDSLLADVGCILDNALLYNSPESEVVSQGARVIPEAKMLIDQVANRHQKEQNARDKADEERKKKISLQFNAAAFVQSNSSIVQEADDKAAKSRRSSISKDESVRQGPFLEPLHRDWLEQSSPDAVWQVGASVQAQPQKNQVRWMPQCGDVVLYSRELHSDFIKGHHESLLTEQCSLPQFVIRRKKSPPEAASTNAVTQSDQGAAIASAQPAALLGVPSIISENLEHTTKGDYCSHEEDGTKKANDSIKKGDEIMMEASDELSQRAGVVLPKESSEGLRDTEETEPAAAHLAMKRKTASPDASPGEVDTQQESTEDGKQENSRTLDGLRSPQLETGTDGNSGTQDVDCTKQASGTIIAKAIQGKESSEGSCEIDREPEESGHASAQTQSIAPETPNAQLVRTDERTQDHSLGADQSDTPGNAQDEAVVEDGKSSGQEVNGAVQAGDAISEDAKAMLANVSSEGSSEIGRVGEGSKQAAAAFETNQTRASPDTTPVEPDAQVIPTEQAKDAICGDAKPVTAIGESTGSREGERYAEEAEYSAAPNQKNTEPRTPPVAADAQLDRTEEKIRYHSKPLGGATSESLPLESASDGNSSSQEEAVRASEGKLAIPARDSSAVSDEVDSDAKISEHTAAELEIDRKRTSSDAPPAEADAKQDKAEKIAQDHSTPLGVHHVVTSGNLQRETDSGGKPSSKEVDASEQGRDAIRGVAKAPPANESSEIKESIEDNPNAEANSDAADRVLVEALHSNYLAGRIVWVRRVFPRNPSKRDKASDTFDTRSPLLSIGICFDYEWSQGQQIHTIFWRPCHVHDSNATSETSESCSACGCNSHFGFLLPAWLYQGAQNEWFSERPILCPDQERVQSDSHFERPSGVCREDVLAINRCFNLLKRRCLGGIPPDSVDSNFTIANVKKGWKPTNKLGSKPVPAFESLLGYENAGDIERASNRKLANDRKWTNKVEQTTSIPILAQIHFLPPFSQAPVASKGKGKGTRKKPAGVSFEESLCPSPKLCLELIQQRLRSGYYRQRNAIIDDIQEAYVSSVLLVLAKEASKKFGNVSTRKVARFLNKYATTKNPFSKKGRKKSENDDSIKRGPQQSDEEAAVTEKLQQVRSLHAMALLSVSETKCFERIFGTTPKKAESVTESNKPSEREQVFKAARHKLAITLAALGRDPCKHRGKSKPLRNATVFGNQEGNVFPSVSFKIVSKSKLSVDKTPLPPIIFAPQEYSNQEKLVRYFFGKPHRMNACGRCQVYRRSMLVCRVQRGHSNKDFAWADIMSNTGGIDGLLYSLRTGNRPLLPSTAPNEGAAKPGDTTADGEKQDRINDKADDAADSSAVIERQKDASERLDLSNQAVELAQKLLEHAQREKESSHFLTDEFVKKSFPVDPADGHYTYCYVCGLSGDVICCESCPIVMHPKCGGIENVPEGDWFCPKCSVIRAPEPMEKSSEEQNASLVAADHSEQGEKKQETSIEDKASQAPSSHEVGEEQVGNTARKSTPVARVDEMKKELEAILSRLRNHRHKENPVRYKKKSEREEEGIEQEKKAQKKDHEDGDDVEEQANAMQSPGRRQSRKPKRWIDETVAEEARESPSKTSQNDELLPIGAGSKISKKFGKRGHFMGVVEDLPKADYPFYSVKYEDGDVEDMDEDEIRRYMIFRKSPKKRRVQATHDDERPRKRGRPPRDSFESPARRGRKHNAAVLEALSPESSTKVRFGPGSRVTPKKKKFHGKSATIVKEVAEKTWKVRFDDGVNRGTFKSQQLAVLLEPKREIPGSARKRPGQGPSDSSSIRFGIGSRVLPKKKKWQGKFGTIVQEVEKFTWEVRFDDGVDRGIFKSQQLLMPNDEEDAESQDEQEVDSDDDYDKKPRSRARKKPQTDSQGEPARFQPGARVVPKKKVWQDLAATIVREVSHRVWEVRFDDGVDRGHLKSQQLLWLSGDDEGGSEVEEEAPEPKREPRRSLTPSKKVSGSNASVSYGPGSRVMPKKNIYQGKTGTIAKSIGKHTWKVDFDDGVDRGTFKSQQLFALDDEDPHDDDDDVDDDEPADEPANEPPARSPARSRRGRASVGTSPEEKVEESPTRSRRGRARAEPERKSVDFAAILQEEDSTPERGRGRERKPAPNAARGESPARSSSRRRNAPARFKPEDDSPARKIDHAKMSSDQESDEEDEPSQPKNETAASRKRKQPEEVADSDESSGEQPTTRKRRPPNKYQ